MHKQTEAHRTRRGTNVIDRGMDRLHRDLQESAPRENEDANFSNNPAIDVEALSSEVERLRKRLAIWEIFLRYAEDGAQTWPEVQRAVTPEDLDEITRICNGMPVRDVLLNLR